VDDFDIHFMRLAIREARKGLGRTSPNPCVGALVVKNGKVVGKGYHKRAGLPHAEPNALQDAGPKAKDATLYVTLEPCNHAGRTPPCTHSIIKSGIKRVVVGMADPNPRVAGGGAAYLAAHSVEVTSLVLDDQCRELNLPFIKHSTTGLPWVVMKAGMSVDGKIAASVGERTAITGKQSRQKTHQLRDQCDAILIGGHTALVDNPSLTTRLSKGRQGKDPIRIILDTTLRLPPNSKMLQQESESDTWVFCGPNALSSREKVLQKAGAKVFRVDEDANGLDLSSVLKLMGQKQILSVLVEGGGRVHGSLLAKGLVDQVFLFIAPMFLGSEGVPVVDFYAENLLGSSPRFTTTHVRHLGDDLLIEGRFIC
jgi:diaminohydroxyphosphoribosylaminopyrimidine deaminase/5-amino-6-(5-phosphoribosylamino)uracil reductase